MIDRIIEIYNNNKELFSVIIKISSILISILIPLIIFRLNHKRNAKNDEKHNWELFSKSLLALHSNILEISLKKDLILNEPNLGAINSYIELDKLLKECKISYLKLKFSKNYASVYNTFISEAVPLFTDVLGQIRYYYSDINDSIYKEVLGATCFKYLKKNLNLIRIEIDNLYQLHEKKILNQSFFERFKNIILIKKRLIIIKQNIHKITHRNLIVQLIAYNIYCMKEYKPQVYNMDKLLKELNLILEEEDNHSAIEISKIIGLKIDEFIEYDKSIDEESTLYYEDGNSLLKNKQYKKAIIEFDKAIKIYPTDHVSLLQKAYCLSELGLFEDAIHIYDEVIKLVPNLPTVFYNKANCLTSIGNFKEAIIVYDIAINFNPNYYEAFINKGLTLGKINKLKEAIGVLNRAIDIKPDDSFPYFKKGIYLVMIKKHYKAIKAFDSAIELEPHNFKYFFYKGCSLHAIKDYHNAIIYFDKSIMEKNDYFESYYFNAISNSLLGNYLEAINHLDKCLQLNPNHNNATSLKSKIEMKITEK